MRPLAGQDTDEWHEFHGVRVTRQVSRGAHQLVPRGRARPTGGTLRARAAALQASSGDFVQRRFGEGLHGGQFLQESFR